MVIFLSLGQCKICQVVCYWPSRATVIIKSLSTSHGSLNLTWALGILYPLRTKRECSCASHVSIVCTICLTWYSLHCGGSRIFGVVRSKVEPLCKCSCGICCDVGKCRCSSYVCEILLSKPINTLQIWDCLVCDNHFCIHKHSLYSLHTKQTSILKGLIPMKVLATCKDTRWQSMPT